MPLNSIDYYYDLIDGLEAIGIDILPLSHLKPSSEPAIGLRHDVDNLPHVALHMARYLAMKGVPGSFYLLPSSTYYTPELISQVVYRMNVYGCEIGLHNDSWYYGEQGPEKTKAELEHLRSLGARVLGTVAHNSFSTYNAENYEVFKERVLFDRDVELPLGKLSMKKLGLTIEGTFAIPKRSVNLDTFSEYLKIKPDIQSEEWMYKFLVDNPYCDYETYAQFWLIGADEWAVAIRRKLHWKVGLTKVLSLVKTLPPTTMSIFVIHPDYFDDSCLSENIEVNIPPMWRWHTGLPESVKVIGRQIRRDYHALKSWLSQRKKFLVPVSERWETAQENYVKWASEPLESRYLNEIIDLGERFSDYIGDPLHCLDVGCGNGMFGGKTYAEVRYSYLTETPGSYIVGIDPLPQIAIIPWLNEYTHAEMENNPYPDNTFDKVVIATSLDHVKNPEKCIAECHRVLKPDGALYIWTTYKDYTDEHHPHRIQKNELHRLLAKNSFTIVDETKVAENDQFFIKADVRK